MTAPRNRHVARVAVALALAVAVPPAAGAAARSSRSPRPPIGDILPQHFGFGVSWFSGARDWPEKAKTEHGVHWDYFYVYVFPEYKDKGGTHWDYLGRLFDRCRRLNAIPIASFYGMLRLADAQGYEGTEAERVNRVIRDPVAMKVYFEETVRILKMCARHKGYVIFHSEPDSWAFMQWLGSNDTHDATQVPASVASCGMPDVAEFPDNAAGIAQALLHLRDLYAPHNTYMGFHAKDCRVGMWPERTVKFISSCGKWDILVGDGIGHVLSTRGEGWWDAWDESRHKRYMNWFGTVTKELGLKYIHWQSVIGKSDYTLMPDYPKAQRITEYIKAGSVGVTFDLRVKRGEDPGTAGNSDSNHGYSMSPPPGHPAQKTPNDLRERLARYYRQPIPLSLRRVKKKKPAKKKLAALKPPPPRPQPVVTFDQRAPICVMLERAANASQKAVWIDLTGRSQRVTVTGATEDGLCVTAAGGLALTIEWVRLSGPSLVRLVAAYGPDDEHAVAAAREIARAHGMDEYVRSLAGGG